MEKPILAVTVNENKFAINIKDLVDVILPIPKTYIIPANHTTNELIIKWNNMPLSVFDINNKIDTEITLDSGVDNAQDDIKKSQYNTKYKTVIVLKAQRKKEEKLQDIYFGIFCDMHPETFYISVDKIKTIDELINEDNKNSNYFFNEVLPFSICALNINNRDIPYIENNNILKMLGI